MTAAKSSLDLDSETPTLGFLKLDTENRSHTTDPKMAKNNHRKQPQKLLKKLLGKWGQPQLAQGAVANSDPSKPRGATW